MTMTMRPCFIYTYVNKTIQRLKMRGEKRERSSEKEIIEFVCACVRVRERVGITVETSVRTDVVEEDAERKSFLVRAPNDNPSVEYS